MNIGIYKPYKKIFFEPSDDDYSSWSRDITPVVSIFANKGHKIFILSATDLDELKYKNVYKGSLVNTYDRIFFFNGYIEGDELGIVEKLRAKTKRLDLVITDLRLTPDRLELFDNVYSQTAKQDQYSGIVESVAYNFEFEPLGHVIDKKDILYYFNGSERNRTVDFFEYVWRPDCKIHGKSKFLDFDNRVGFYKSMETLKKSKYSIVIADIEYNKLGFITARYYDNIINDVINFTDYKYDPDEILIKKDDWRRVSSYIELKLKMDYLETHQLDYLNLLRHQRTEIKKSYITGEYTYSLLN